MITDDTTLRLIALQRLLIQAQELALKMPEMGLDPDSFVYQPTENLIGILAFLQRKHAEKSRVG